MCARVCEAGILERCDAALGYRIVEPEPRGRKIKKKLDIEAVEAAVRLMFKLYLEETATLSRILFRRDCSATAARAAALSRQSQPWFRSGAAACPSRKSWRRRGIGFGATLESVGFGAVTAFVALIAARPDCRPGVLRSTCKRDALV
jgi:hypothetical protein